MVPAVFRPHVATVHAAHMALFAQAMCNPAQVAHLWAASMAVQTMVQQQGGGQSIQRQGGRQTAQLAGSKKARHEPAAGAADAHQEGQKKAKGDLVFITDHWLADLECLKETPTPFTWRNAFSRARSM